MSVTFTTAVYQPEGMNATGLPVPAEAVAELGGSKNQAVVVTLGVEPAPYTYRSSLGSRDGRTLISLSSAHRAASGVAAGDTVTVTLDIDDAPREMVIPDDVTAALSAAGLLEAFTALSFSKQRGFIEPVEAAKAADTRIRRIEKIVSTLSGA